MQPKEQSDFAKFDGAVRQILTVSHAELKKKLDAEKRRKARGKRSKSSASRDSGGV